MCRALVIAIAAGALALAGCTANSNDSSAALPFGGAQTVGDAAALAAHRPTDSQNTAAAIEAVGALGSRINLLAVDPGWLDVRTAPGLCHDGVEVAIPRRGGQIDSTETREFYDAACTQLARDTHRRYYPRSNGSEVVALTTAIYARGGARPIAMRSETATITAAAFTRWGFPSAAHGFTQAASGALWVRDRRQSVFASAVTLLPGRAGTNVYCRAAAAFSPSGVPALDAAFGWDGTTVGAPAAATRQSDQRGDVTFASLQKGSIYAGPIGSLRLTARRTAAGCPAGDWAFGVSGGVPAADFSLPIRATYRNGTLVSLSVSGASLGAYRLTATTVRNGLDDRSVAGVLVSGGVRIASLESDTFGNGVLTVTSTGAQYRLIDWTIVR